MHQITRFFPILEQARTYNREKFSSDLVAALVVTTMLVPQSLAYAMLAGLPAQVGLYASIFPLVAYAIFGSCRTLAVGPVAIASLMTASALGQATQQGVVGYVDGAMLLALMSGGFLFLLGVFRMGFLSHFLSHSVIAGFVMASGLVIAASQIKHIFGVSAQGHNFIEVMSELSLNVSDFHPVTLTLGISSLMFLLWARRHPVSLLCRLGMKRELATTLSKITPLLGVIGVTILVATLRLDLRGVSVVGVVPAGMPSLTAPSFSLSAVKILLVPALLISIIAYIESFSVGKTLSAKEQQKLDGDQELLGLGASNIAAGMSGGFPVSGGFSRSVINFDAGAKTQFTGIFTAVGIAAIAWSLTPLLYYIPVVMLAAIIIVAVLSLIDVAIIRQSWSFSKSDFFAVLITIAVTLVFGVESGIASGIATSILLHLYHTSEPHIAEIGLIAGTEHFRNVRHFEVQTQANIASLRIDESLLFSNAGYLEDHIDALLAERPQVDHVILHCGAINTIDLSALDMLKRQNRKFRDGNKYLHLSELKIPVKLKLDQVNFIDELTGSLYLSHFDAFKSLKG